MPVPSLHVSGITPDWGIHEDCQRQKQQLCLKLNGVRTLKNKSLECCTKGYIRKYTCISNNFMDRAVDICISLFVILGK